MRKFEIVVNKEDVNEVEAYFVNKGIDFHKYEGKSFDKTTRELKPIAMYIITAKTKDIAIFNKNNVRVI